MKNKLMMAVGVAIAMGSANADLWLDGLMTDAEIQDYNYELSMGYDMNNLYEFNGNYYDTLVDTTVNMNHQKLFEDGHSTTYFTDTGAETIYQARDNFSMDDVMLHFESNEDKNIGFNAEILRGTDRRGNRFEYQELANGMYQNTLYTDVVISKRQVRNDLEKWSDFDTVTTTDKWGTRTAPPVEWTGITAEKLYDLNKDKLEYTLKKGDSKGDAAKALGLTMREFYAANPGVYGKHTKIGQKFVSGGFKQGDHIRVKDWDQVDIDNSRNAHIKDTNDTRWDARYYDAPTTMSSQRVGYNVQAGNGKWKVINALDVSIGDLYSSNDGLIGRRLQVGELLMGGTLLTHNGSIAGFDAIEIETTSTLVNVNSAYAKPDEGYVPPVPGLNW